MSNRPFSCACEACGAINRPLVFDGFLSAALCVPCQAKPPAEFLDQRASDWYGPEGRITHVPIQLPKFTGKMYAQ